MKKIMFILVSTGLFLTSCKKETTVINIETPEKKIQTMEYSNSAGTSFSTLYVYDSQGKLKEIKYKNETETFTYNSPLSFTITRTPNSDPTQFITDLYTLNNKGAVEKMETRYYSGLVFSISTYSYNQDNILQAIETAYPTQNKVFRFENTITNGLITARSFRINNVLQSREEFSYDMTRSMKGVYQLTSYNYFPGLFGAVPAFPLAGTKFFDAAGNLQETRSYTTVIDNAGYCSSYAGNDSNSGNTFSFQFKYQ